MASSLRVFYKGSFLVVARPWVALGGAMGLALMPLLNQWVSIPIGIGIALLAALIASYLYACHQLEEYDARWNQQEKWMDVAHRLGEFGLQGKAFVPKPYDKVASWEEIREWTGRVGLYIEHTLGKGHRFLFDSGAGNEPRVPDKILPGEDRERWIHIQARLMTLKKMVWQAVEKADIKP